MVRPRRDMMALLSGVKVPMTIRHVEGSVYRLVAPAHVHGIIKEKLGMTIHET